MGGFCSKMEENDDNNQHSNNHQRKAGNNTKNIKNGQRRNINIDDNDSDDENIRQNRMNHYNKRKVGKFSIARIGSRTTISTQSNTSNNSNNKNKNNNKNNNMMMEYPNSPTHRASNYNHLHNALAVNFEEARKNSLHYDDIPLGVVGLRNLGNTCFLNSSLQCLSATIPLTDYFLGYDYRSELNINNPLGTGGKLAIAYAELMKDMWLFSSKTIKNNNNGSNNSSTKVIIKPTLFKSQLEKFAPQFRGYKQHDSQELLALLLDGIHEDLNRIIKKPYIEDKDCDGTTDEIDAINAWKNYLKRDKSLIVDIFQGQLRSKLQCMKCKHTNIRFEPFMYLSLPISNTCRTIQDCLNLYLKQEYMTGQNQWYCSKCKTHRDATKKTDLWVLPPILIIHLKRFNFDDFGRCMGSKNNIPIKYQISNWDLSKHVKSRGSEYPSYDLYAVSNHLGGTGGGHYTAYTQNRFDDRWYEFNDNTYRPIDERELLRNCQSAYVLFYNRVQQFDTDSSCTSGNNNNNNGGNADNSTSMELYARGAPLIRRQSENRPDLWPHTQVQHNQFREFSRQSLRTLASAPTLDDDDVNDNDILDSRTNNNSSRKKKSNNNNNYKNNSKIKMMDDSKETDVTSQDADSIEPPLTSQQYNNNGQSRSNNSNSRQQQQQQQRKNNKNSTTNNTKSSSSMPVRYHC